ncbi:protein SIEVE ELEMENT OCCLUSION B [Cannabis sativa]|uniref:protein SIEVE ELEMENT OCCLUSION B n=1 Tax=Cannabis sativa TaxID=3483 RepID=UPI0029CA80AC|nr:protein SIEVE ELEMENT OCCLUSION B [Cannabis sativa]
MEINPFKVGEDFITAQVNDTHATYVDSSFDANSFFIIVANILRQSTEIVQKSLQGDKITPKLEGSFHKENFKIPMCLIKSIGCELFSCKEPSAEIGHETTVKILKKLRSYSWEAKLTLTLAAFAKEFGELLMHIGEVHPQDHLTTSLAILKGSLILPTTTTTRKNALIQLNDLIKLTLQLIEIIFRSHLLLKPIHVYWIIITVVACANKVNILTADEEKAHDLYPYYIKIGKYKSELELTADRSPKPIGVIDVERDYYELLKVLCQNNKESIEFLSRLFSTRDSSRGVQLIDCSAYFRTVQIDVLRKKTVLLVFSRVVGRYDITTNDINLLKRIQFEKIKRERMEEQYAIVWVPIVDETHDQLTQYRKEIEFQRLLASKDIQWYTVNSLALHKGSLKFLKEEWKFETSPICVVMDLAQGRVQNINAFYSMRLWGLDAFPFDKESEHRVVHEMTWINTVFSREFIARSQSFSIWVERNDYIIIHGGTDMAWSREIQDKMRYMRMETNIKIELFNINEESYVEQFWSGAKTLVEKYYKVEYAKQQVQRLNSLKQAKGWFMLNKGSTTLVVGSRETLVKAVEELNIWKESITKKTFEVAFKEYHEKIFIMVPRPSDDPCLTIVNPLKEDGKTMLKEMKCTKCGRDMEMTSVTFRCCHVNNIPKPTISSSPYDY